MLDRKNKELQLEVENGRSAVKDNARLIIDLSTLTAEYEGCKHKYTTLENYFNETKRQKSDFESQLFNLSKDNDALLQERDNLSRLNKKLREES